MVLGRKYTWWDGQVCGNEGRKPQKEKERVRSEAGQQEKKTCKEKRETPLTDQKRFFSFSYSSRSPNKTPDIPDAITKVTDGREPAESGTDGQPSEQTTHWCRYRPNNVTFNAI